MLAVLTGISLLAYWAFWVKHHWKMMKLNVLWVCDWDVCWCLCLVGLRPSRDCSIPIRASETV